MSLSIDSLVTDLIFQSGDALEPETLVEVLGGEEELAKLQVVDPDMQDPRFEMELSPSMPFRRRGERRLMLIDDSVAPMRADPRSDTIVPIDLRPARAKLVEVCAATPVRLGRLFALGSWGDAVWVVRNLRDLRAICLLSWALDPSMDLEGRRRASPLGQNEFEEKILSFDKRLDELDDAAIRESLEGANVVEEGDLIIVDVLEEDGTWDLVKSIELETKIAALDKFSTIVGARSSAAPKKKPAPEPEPVVAAKPEPDRNLPPVRTARLSDSLVLIFPPERFDLDVAAALGKKDWDTVLSSTDGIAGADKDHIYQRGAEFVAPVEFLSEVFVQGKPLSKAQFEEGASTVGNTRTMEVHFPRFGPVLLCARSDGSRFVSSMLDNTEELLAAIS